MAAILAEVRSPDGAVVAAKRRGDRPPVDEVFGVPDEQPRSVIEAGVSEVKIVAHADGTAVRVVAAEDGVAIHTCGLSE